MPERLSFATKAALAALVVGASASEIHAQSLAGGLRADGALATFQNADFETDPRLGLRTGFWTDLTIAGQLDVRAEAVFATKGVKNAESSVDATVELDYFEVPVLLKLRLSRTAGPFVMAGPVIGIKVSSRMVTNSGSFDYADLVHPIDYGWAAGLGFDAIVGGMGVTLDARYFRGLRAVFDFGDPSDTDSDDKNQVFSAGVGVRLF